MADFRKICREYTRLTAVQQEYLQRLIVVLPFAADLAHARARLYLPVKDGKSFVIAAQTWPHTVILTADGSHPGDVVRRLEEPLISRALKEDKLVKGKREWNYGSMMDMAVLPIHGGSLLPALGALCFETTLEITRSEGYYRLFHAVRALLQNVRRIKDPAMVRPMTASDGIVITDEYNRITFVTTGAQRVLRAFGIGSPIGMHIYDHEFTQYVTEETQVTRRPWEREIKAGNIVLNVRHLPVKEGGRLLCRVVILSDLTELRKKDREIKVQSAIIREIHHRVKNNLQTIASLLRLQARRSTSPEVKAALKESVNRILSISVVHEFLSEQGHATINVKEIAEQIFRLVAMSMVDKEFVLHTDCHGDPLVLPSAYASSLGLVLNELVLNATEHGFAGRKSGTIDLATRETEDGYALRFEDDGIGLPPDFDAARARSLGVSIMRTLVEGDLQGSIRFSSGEKGGTAVEIEIPKKGRQEE